MSMFTPKMDAFVSPLFPFLVAINIPGMDQRQEQRGYSVDLTGEDGTEVSFEELKARSMHLSSTRNPFIDPKHKKKESSLLKRLSDTIIEEDHGKDHAMNPTNVDDSLSTHCWLLDRENRPRKRPMIETTCLYRTISREETGLWLSLLDASDQTSSSTRPLPLDGTDYLVVRRHVASGGLLVHTEKRTGGTYLLHKLTSSPMGPLHDDLLSHLRLVLPMEIMNDGFGNALGLYPSLPTFTLQDWLKTHLSSGPSFSILDELVLLHFLKELLLVPYEPSTYTLADLYIDFDQEALLRLFVHDPVLLTAQGISSSQMHPSPHTILGFFRSTFLSHTPNLSLPIWSSLWRINPSTPTSTIESLVPVLERFLSSTHGVPSISTLLKREHIRLFQKLAGP